MVLPGGGSHHDSSCCSHLLGAPMVLSRAAIALLISVFWLPLLTLNGAERPPYIAESVWEAVSPFLLPDEHNLKSRLDELFSSPITGSKAELESRGFFRFGENHTSGIQVMAHKKLKQWLIKIYTEDHPESPHAWQKYVHRCIGARTADRSIKTRGYEKHFAVPKKYIYTLPYPSSGPFLLVVERLPVYNHSDNKKIWRSGVVSKKLLKEFYEVLNDAGLADCCMIDNAAWGTNHKINLIDTEHHHMWPPAYYKLTRYLPSKLQPYWQEIAH